MAELQSQECPACKGSGQLEHHSFKGSDWRACPDCCGVGEVDDDEDERGEDYDPSPMCNCGTCTDGNYTCVELD